MANPSFGGSSTCCDGTGGLRWDFRLLGIVLAFTCFCATFALAWKLMSSYYARFADLSIAMRSDVSSRANSVLHSAIVVPALIVGIAVMPWGNYYEPLGDVSFLQGVLCVSLGYFMCDTLLLFAYQPPQWLGFAAHHIVASIPYIIYLFAQSCSYGLFILACFMLVEATNISLHTRATLEEHGMGNTRAYAISLYVTFFGWIVFRLMNPTFLLVVIHLYIVPSIPSGRLGCILPGVICAYMINIFCYAVFILILCREVVHRWQRAPDPYDIAPVESMQTTDLASRGVTPDDQKIIQECPSRMLLYETQENLREHLERSGVLENRRPRSNSLRDTFASSL